MYSEAKAGIYHSYYQVCIKSVRMPAVNYKITYLPLVNWPKETNSTLQRIIIDWWNNLELDWIIVNHML